MNKLQNLRSQHDARNIERLLHNATIVNGADAASRRERTHLLYRALTTSERLTARLRRMTKRPI